MLGASVCENSLGRGILLETSVNAARTKGRGAPLRSPQSRPRRTNAPVQPRCRTENHSPEANARLIVVSEIVRSSSRREEPQVFHAVGSELRQVIGQLSSRVRARGALGDSPTQAKLVADQYATFVGSAPASRMATVLAASIGTRNETA